ncbi:hypothetical protein [Nocardia cyriacigeorgica]|uniref:hypothetical protein n=1 Tax=Nocardia cyriacigeorgica TaxID=135487 RepID=UPI002453DE57|nr:hypothetical protein [Nocardia cyriacigeorgica]
MELELAVSNRLYAVGGPDRIEVYRSPVVKDRHDVYRPVADYIQRHGLVLAASDVHEDDSMFFGEAAYSIYTQARPGAPAEHTGSMSMYMAALRCGMSFDEYFAVLVEDGMILEHPNGGYIPSPHPSVVPRYPAAQ